MLNRYMENVKDLSVITKDLYDLLRNRFKTVRMKGSEGEDVDDPAIAVTYYLGFLDAVITVDDKTVAVAYDSSRLDRQADDIKRRWFRFMEELREFSRSKLLQFEPGDIEKSNLDKREGSMMNESKMYGTNRTSYQKVGEATIIVKHSQPINVELPAARTQHIESIYIESANGERYRYSQKHLNGARAMAMHVSHGGNVYDPIGSYIVSLSEELSELRRFKNYTLRAGLSEAMGDITERVLARIDGIKDEIGKLQRESVYQAFAEEFAPIDSKDIPEELVDQWVDALTVKTFNEELKSVFPYIYRLVDHKKAELGYEDLVSEAVESEESEEYEVESYVDPMDGYVELLDGIELAHEKYSDKKMDLSDEIVEYIKSFYNAEDGTFPLSEERVKIAVEKKFGEKAGRFAAYAAEQLSGKKATEEYDHDSLDQADVDYIDKRAEEGEEGYYIRPVDGKYVAGYKDSQDNFEIGIASSEEEAEKMIDSHKADMDHLFGIKKLAGVDEERSRESKQNWFDTLNQALEAEGLIDEWPLSKSLAYGETFKFDTEDGRHVSIYRSDSGRYERPIVYRLESQANEELEQILRLSNLK